MSYNLGKPELIPIPGLSRNMIHDEPCEEKKPEHITVTVTSGWATTETIEASLEVTASVSAGFGAADFSLDASSGFSASTSDSLSKETTVVRTFAFNPGYITAYYNWCTTLKGERALDSGTPVKITAKSYDELEEKKLKLLQAVDEVTLTARKIVPPETFKIKGVFYNEFLNCDYDGTGDCYLRPKPNEREQVMVAEVVDKGKNLYRFKNKYSGWYLHCDGGEGRLRMQQRGADRDQIFQLIPTEENGADQFRLASWYSPCYKMHWTQKVLQMYELPNSPNDRIYKFSRPDSMAAQSEKEGKGKRTAKKNKKNKKKKNDNRFLLRSYL